MALDQNPHQTVTCFGCVGFSMYVCGFSAPQMRNFACLHTRKDQNELHMKRCFFFAKIGIFCKSIAGPHPSIVQAYSQQYSYGGRLKLIICQIRHEINTSWKKLDGGPYSCGYGVNTRLHCSWSYHEFKFWNTFPNTLTGISVMTTVCLKSFKCILTKNSLVEFIWHDLGGRWKWKLFNKLTHK